MERPLENTPSFDNILEQFSLTGDVVRLIDQLNDKLRINPDYDCDTDLEVLNELIGHEYFGQPCNVDGTLYAYDLQSGEIDILGDTTAQECKGVIFFEWPVVAEDATGRAQLYLRFSVQDEYDEENFVAYAAQFDDIRKLEVMPNESFESEDDLDSIDCYTHLQELHDEVIRQSQAEEFTQGSPEERTAIIDSALVRVGGDIRTIFDEFIVYPGENPYITFQPDMYYELSTTDVDAIDWRESKHDRRDVVEEDPRPLVVSGEYRGVIIPAEHPACSELRDIDEDSDLLNAPHIVVDCRDDERMALVPLCYIDRIQGV